MEHSIENQLQLPVVHNGVEFPRLEMVDLITWTAEEKTNARKAAEIRYAKNGPGGQGLTAFESQQMIQSVIDKGFPLGRLLDLAIEAPGVHKALIKSLKKSGKSDEQAVGLLKQIHFTDQYHIAQSVLSPPAPLHKSQQTGEDEPPLPKGQSETG